MSTVFGQKLMGRIEECRSNDWKDNWDARRYGSYHRRSLVSRAKAVLRSVIESSGMRPNGTLSLIKKSENNLQWVYDQLEDDESRQLLIDLMAFRVLGHRRVKLPLNTPGYWIKLEELEAGMKDDEGIELDFLNWKLDRFDLSHEGYPITLYARPTAVYTQLLLQQYRCVTDNKILEATSGETVIDAGGCYGDTALYFAHKVGVDGRVFSFEFMPNNIEIFKTNLTLNPGLAPTIEIVPCPVWSSSENQLFVEGSGPASHITHNPTDSRSVRVETLSIDDLVKYKKISRVDFIKMDIEGAELEALKGAHAVILRDRPKLAISVYHRLEDFWSIPLWINSLNLGYCFYLRHFTIHAEETVLFADVSH